MTLMKWRPLNNLFSVTEQLNRLFDDEMFKNDWGRLTMNDWTPLTDIIEKKDSFVLRMELPGFKKDDINVEFHNDTLTIKGERKKETEVKDENCRRVERNYGSFERSFSLPNNIDTKKIKASLKDGVMELIIPKTEEAKSKAIPITVE